jgi:hypothetical protein
MSTLVLSLGKEDIVRIVDLDSGKLIYISAKKKPGSSSVHVAIDADRSYDIRREKLPAEEAK